MANINPVGPVVRGDFFAVIGNAIAIPKKAKMVFRSPGAEVEVTPNLVRPHWVLRARLPNTVPLGHQTLQLKAGGWSSDQVPINVMGGAKPTVRLLYPGAQKASPYTIALVANPAIASKNASQFRADPIMTERSSFHDAVGKTLRVLLTLKEDILRQFETNIEFLTVFDGSAAPGDQTALAIDATVDFEEILEPRRAKVAPFLGPHGVNADVVFLLSGEPVQRAVARPTTDSQAQTTKLAYGGHAKPQGHFPTVPGSIVLPLEVLEGALDPTAIHEFCHAAASSDEGRVIDLYVDEDDGSGLFTVNKKWRDLVGGNIPNVPDAFVTAVGTDFASDKKRNSVGYENTWTSYHPELVDKKRVNLMDDFNFSKDPKKCRLDTLTYAWLSKRLQAKINR